MSWNINKPGDYIDGPLTVVGAATFNSQVTVNSTLQVTGNVAGQGALIGRDGSSGGATYGSNIGNTNINSPGTIRFNVNNGTFAGLFDTSGNFAIGTTPVAWISAVKGFQIGAYGAVAGSSSNMNVLGNLYSSPGGTAYLANGFGTLFQMTNGQYVFYLAGNNTSGAGALVSSLTQAVTIDSSGRLLVGPGSANANGGVLQLSSGITFPSAQSASTDANTLDDYEEGTFTPTLSSVGGAGFAYTPGGLDGGVYTKIGSRVFFSIRINGTYTGTYGYIRFGVPFTVSGLQPPDATVGYNNDTGVAITGRTDPGNARFISYLGLSGAYLVFSGSFTV